MAGMDHAPPPFFKRGPAPLALLTFYLALALAVFMVDLRLRSIDRLRQLLGVREREKTSGQVAHILYTARDPFSRKVIVDKGQQAGITSGQPAIDEAGVVGQVTRVFPFSAEVTLITDT